MGNVLLVDDQRDSRGRLQGLLESQGFAVISLPSLAMAVPIAKTDPPDLALLNISRCRDEGLNACRDIRRYCPKTRIVLCIEGGPTDADANMGLMAGADEVIPDVRDLSEISRFLEAASAGHSLTCPECQHVFRLKEMPVPGSRVEAQCPACHSLIGVLPQGPEEVTRDPGADGRAKILVVEDTKFFRAYLTDLLVSAGFQVVTARDGVEALEYMRGESPDLVITDVLMPRMHGFDLCRKIKERPETASVPVILMTQVYTQLHHEKEARGAYGADDYIVKPFQPSDLLARIWRFLPHNM